MLCAMVLVWHYFVDWEGTHSWENGNIFAAINVVVELKKELRLMLKARLSNYFWSKNMLGLLP